MNSVFPSVPSVRAWFRAIPLAALLACAWLLPGRAMAANNDCWIGATSIAFGSVGQGGTTTSSSLTYTCNNDTPTGRSFRVCLYMDPGAVTGVAPRRLKHDSSEDYLNYDLYADPAMTQLIGSTTSNHPIYSVTFTTNTAQPSGLIPLYGRVPAGQNVTAGNYNAYISAVLRWVSQSGSTAPSAAQCAASTAQASNGGTNVTATFADTCYISAASDMDFGSVANLASARNATSTISLRCPTNTKWQLALNYGSNPNGTTRRMIGPSGNYIIYELHQDAARNTPWGSTTVPGTGTNAIQTLTVYGRVPAQAVNSAGTYTDTVTITLTY